ncbi:MAG: hypothetical protein F2796_07135, partial [Actinobacteria bacterium]|nr:hypothetical protein [Actinomycetota bacterium]
MPLMIVISSSECCGEERADDDCQDGQSDDVGDAVEGVGDLAHPGAEGALEAGGGVGVAGEGEADEEQPEAGEDDRAGELGRADVLHVAADAERHERIADAPARLAEQQGERDQRGHHAGHVGNAE